MIMKRCELIAEIGWNHMGNMELAEKNDIGSIQIRS